MGRVCLLNSTGTEVITPAKDETLVSIVTLLGTTGIKVNGLTFDSDVELGEVQLNNAAGTTVNPSTEDTLSAMSLKVRAADESALGSTASLLNIIASKMDDVIAVTPQDYTQAANTAWADGDLVLPAGAVRKNTRALPEDVTDGDYSVLQVTTNGDLRVKDDDANTALADVIEMLSDLDSLAGPHKVSVTTNTLTIAELLTAAGISPATLNASTTVIQITVESSGVHWAFGTATSNSCPLLVGINQIAKASTAGRALTDLELISASGTITVWIEEFC